jgi:hypothetical protein
MKTEQSSVVFRVPDFIDADGIEYADIEVSWKWRDSRHRSAC